MIKNMAKSIRWLLLMNPQTFTGISISIQSCCTVQSQLLVPVPAPIPAIQFRSCRRDRLSAVCNNNFSSLVDADYNFCIRAPPPHPMAISVILIPSCCWWMTTTNGAMMMMMIRIEVRQRRRMNEWMPWWMDGWLVGLTERARSYNL